MERVVERVDALIPAQPKALRVCAYARVSTGKDAMLHSLSAQVSYYSKMIQSHNGWMYCGVYSDEAVTGTKRERAGFQHMIEECRQGNIDLVITKSISRFARNTVTLLQTVRELKNLGVDVFFEEQHIHTMSADGELMMTILASYAQEESLSASENQKWRVRKAFENGEIINLRFLFGYDITPDGIRVNEVDAAIVREIFERFNGGESMSSICRDLDARGHKGVLGGTWCAERMRNTSAMRSCKSDTATIILKRSCCRTEESFRCTMPRERMSQSSTRQHLIRHRSGSECWRSRLPTARNRLVQFFRG